MSEREGRQCCLSTNPGAAPRRSVSTMGALTRALTARPRTPPTRAAAAVRAGEGSPPGLATHVGGSVRRPAGRPRGSLHERSHAVPTGSGGGGLRLSIRTSVVVSSCGGAGVLWGASVLSETVFTADSCAGVGVSRGCLAAVEFRSRAVWGRWIDGLGWSDWSRSFRFTAWKSVCSAWLRQASTGARSTLVGPPTPRGRALSAG
jgi:hypothetical protein